MNIKRWKYLSYSLVGIVTVLAMILSGFFVNIEKGTNENTVVTITVGNPADAFTGNGSADVTATTATAVQTAINNLPAAGGTVRLISPAFTFTDSPNTVTFPENNIIIEGNGASITNNASTPLFNVGSRTGIVFRNITTDATITNYNTAQLINVKLGATYYSFRPADGTSITGNVVGNISGGTVSGSTVTATGLSSGLDVVTSTGGLLATKALSGATFPVSPKTGDTFLHIVTGRKVLYQYDGSNWMPIIGYGAMTLYVDPVLGTDDLVHGTAAGANALKTIDYTWVYIIPEVVKSTGTTIIPDGNVDIYLAAGTYSERLCLNGKRLDANGWINFHGTLTAVTTGTATGGAAGSTTTPNRVQGSFTANAFTNYLVKFNGNVTAALAGIYRIVGKTTTTNFYPINGTLPGVPANGDTFTIYDWGTVLSSPNSYSGYTMDAQWNVKFSDVKFTNAVAAPFLFAMWSYGYAIFERCNFTATTTVGVWISNTSMFYSWDTIIQYTGTGRALHLDNMSTAELDGLRIVGSDGSGSLGIEFGYGGTLSAFRGCEIEGFAWGIGLDRSSVSTTAPTIYSFIHGCTTAGIKEIYNSNYNKTSETVFGLNLDGTADANTVNYTVDGSSSYDGHNGLDLTLARCTSASVNLPVVPNCTALYYMDSESYDVGSNMVVGNLYGASGAYRQSDADSDATHLQDDDAAFNNYTMGNASFYHYIKWSSAADGVANAGEGWGTYTNSATLEVKKATGANLAGNYYYWIRASYYVAPYTGYYDIKALAAISGVEADKGYYGYIVVNGTATFFDYKQSSTASYRMFLTGSTVLHLTAGDKVFIAANAEGTTNLTWYVTATDGSFLSIKCISID
jgi:hypothetical protein